MTRLRPLLALSLFAGSASAQSVVAPAGLLETGGSSTVFQAAPRTYLEYFAPSNFDSLTAPTLITGIQVRLAAVGNDALPATWPSQPLTFPSFDVQLSAAAPQIVSDGGFISYTGTLADFQAGPATTVRSGQLTVAPGGYGNTGAANEFGPVIGFTTPYLYTPGDSLLLYLTHTGYSPTAEPQAFFATADPQAGTVDAIGSMAGYQAAFDGYSSPFVVQFSVTPTPEPASLFGAAAAGLGLAGWVRRKRAGAVR